MRFLDRTTASEYVYITTSTFRFIFDSYLSRRQTVNSEHFYTLYTLVHGYTSLHAKTRFISSTPLLKYTRATYMCAGALLINVLKDLTTLSLLTIYMLTCDHQKFCRVIDVRWMLTVKLHFNRKLIMIFFPTQK